MLAPTDREFFSRVSDAAFANPFGEERTRLDLALARAPRTAARSEIVDRLVARVRGRLRETKASDFRRLPPADRTLVEQAMLFEIFHRYADRFDALIQDQLKKGERPARVSFAKEALGDLARVDLGTEAAAKYFALFYQLRRAFYFIDQSLPGTSRPMRELRARLWANIFTYDVRLYASDLWQRMEDFSTILLGQTGTGKGTAAAAIGRSGWIPFNDKTESFAESFVGSFLSINLSQFAETLIESELFGHKKGAFTGAVDGHEGVFSRCSPHGSIFLDEIGEIGIPVQIKLLRVLQERTFSPVGGHEASRFSGRVIAATNRRLDELRERGTFRDDFYYRLCSDVIVVPSLFERLREDAGELDLLLASILRHILGKDNSDVLSLVRRIIERDLGPDYTWPGNVRELEQCVRHILISERAGSTTMAAASQGSDEHLLAIARNATVRDLTIRYSKALYARHGTYEEVARRAGLDRRTAKAYVTG